MNDEIFLELVTKHLSCEATDIENKKIQEFLLIEKYEMLFNNIKSNWNNLPNPESASGADDKSALNKLTTKIRLQEPGFTWTEKKKQDNLFGKRFLKIAASIAFIVTLSSAAFYYFFVLNSVRSEVIWSDKITLPGEKSIVTLTDGTRITLNSDSRLKYSNQPNNSLREVYLLGEAYFEVAHNPSKPFVVHSGNLDTRVLGTKFNVNAFDDDDDITVSLLEGKVKVFAQKDKRLIKESILSPKQQYVFNKETFAGHVEFFEDEKIFGWKEDVLIFDDVPLSKVLLSIERAYGVKIQLPDNSYANKLIRAKFQKESIWTIADVIKRGTGLRYNSVKKNNRLEKIIFY